MAHSSEVRWDGAQLEVSNMAVSILDQLYKAEQVYLDLLEVYTYAGGTDQLAADLLFKEQWEARQEAQANAEEVSKVADLKAAIQALHQLYEALTNGAVAQADRATLLRRMG